MQTMHLCLFTIDIKVKKGKQITIYNSLDSLYNIAIKEAVFFNKSV